LSYIQTDTHVEIRNAPTTKLAASALHTRLKQVAETNEPQRKKYKSLSST